MRIVIGEDSALFREGLARLLEDAEHEVVGRAGDATTLVETVERERPDLAIIDVRMPPDGTDDGARAAKELRSRLPDLAVVLLSQHVETRHSVELVSQGGVGYLLKDRVFDVDELPTHGGSIRVYACRAEDDRPEEPAVAALRERERAAGYGSPAGYLGFQAKVEATKRDLLAFLVQARNDGLRVAGYGAPGKGNTLLNYCGIRTDLVDFTVDRNPYKHGLYTPGTHIPIHAPERIDEERPDYVLVLPWNLVEEISAQLEYVAEWGAKLIVPIPLATVIEPGEGARERLAAVRAA